MAHMPATFGQTRTEILRTIDELALLLARKFSALLPGLTWVRQLPGSLAFAKRLRREGVAPSAA